MCNLLVTPDPYQETTFFEGHYKGMFDIAWAHYLCKRAVDYEQDRHARISKVGDRLSSVSFKHGALA